MANNGANQAGSANSDKSSQTFLSALVLQAVIAGVYFIGFSVLHKRARKVYEPRTYLPQENARTDPVPGGLFAWLPHTLRHSNRPVIAHNGLDAYVFLRFVRLNVLIFVPIWLVSWIVLMPVDGTSTGGLSQIQKFTIGNIGPNQQTRLVAHLVLAWVFTLYVLFLVNRECQKFVESRRDYLLSKAHSALPQPRTVLVTGLPEDCRTGPALMKVLEPIGAIERIWIARDLGDDMQEHYDRREKACAKLEAAECTVIKLVAKKQKKGKLDNFKRGEDHVELDTLLEKKERPTHRTSKIPLCGGRKVDTMTWTKDEIVECNEKLELERKDIGEKKAVGSAFVLFRRQIDAHHFAYMPKKDLPIKVNVRYADVHPKGVIWENLKLTSGQRRIRTIISWALTITLIILWAIPVAFVGLVSNVAYLCQKASFLAWLCTLPTPVNGIIQGALPPVALAILFALLPVVIRKFAVLQGVPLVSEVERELMRRYFIFLVIHGFLIVTISSSLVAAIPQIVSNPSSTVNLLATYLPQASTFFLTYFVTVGLGGALATLFQLVPLLIGGVLTSLLGSTPRKLYGLRFQMKEIKWGTQFPLVTLLTVIGLTYSCIAPLVSGFAALAFCLYYLVYKYLLLYVMDQPAEMDTGGSLFPHAINQLFVGLYIEELCLCGLFFLQATKDGVTNSIPGYVMGGLMVALLLITAAFHFYVGRHYGKQWKGLSRAVGDQGVTAESNGAAPLGELYNTATLVADSRHGAYYDSDLSLGDHAFDPVCSYERQKPIWIPNDVWSIGRSEVAGMRARNIAASTEGAEADEEKGKVTIFRSPPELPWSEGAQERIDSVKPAVKPE